MTVRLELTQGDLGEHKVIELNGIRLDGITAATFAGATVVTTVWQGAVSATLTAAVVDGTNVLGQPVGVCTVSFGSWLVTAALGTWRMKHRVTFADASKLTWPEDGPDTVLVTAVG